MTEFWNTRDRSIPVPVIWDAFKVCMRGKFQAYISNVCKGARKELQESEAKAGALEAEYIGNHSPQAYSSLQEALRDDSLIRISTTKIHLLHQSQWIFEQGERSGRLLAWLSREHSSPVSISRIQSSSGEILTNFSQINDQFAAYYQELYSSRVQFTEQELQTYLEKVDLPCLQKLPGSS